MVVLHPSAMHPLSNAPQPEDASSHLCGMMLVCPRSQQASADAHKHEMASVAKLEMAFEQTAINAERRARSRSTAEQELDELCKQIADAEVRSHATARK